MSDKAIYFDYTLCTGCGACSTSCKLWNNIPTEKKSDYNFIEKQSQTTASHWSRVIYSGSNNRFSPISIRCVHCAEPACLKACPASAIVVVSGFVVINHDKCIGCSQCVNACPYGLVAVSGNLDNMPVKQKAYKCHGCVDISVSIPWCASVCPTKALQFGNKTRLLGIMNKRKSVLDSKGISYIEFGRLENGGGSVFMLLPDKIDTILTHNYNEQDFADRNFLYSLFSRMIPGNSSLKRKILDISRLIAG